MSSTRESAFKLVKNLTNGQIKMYNFNLGQKIIWGKGNSSEFQNKVGEIVGFCETQLLIISLEYIKNRGFGPFYTDCDTVILYEKIEIDEQEMEKFL